MKCNGTYSNLEETKFLSMYMKWVAKKSDDLKNFISIKKLVVLPFSDDHDDYREASSVKNDFLSSDFQNKSVFEKKCYLQERLFKTIGEVEKELADNIPWPN